MTKISWKSINKTFEEPIIIIVDAPDTPTLTSAVLGKASATIRFTAPIGGTAVTSYTATSSPGGFTGTVNQSGSGSLVVSGLTNGTGYIFTLVASNSGGDSNPTAASSKVYPMDWEDVESTTGEIWMDRNLGATMKSTSTTTGIGFYCQWGRLTDGHQVPGVSTTSTKSTTNIPGHANFITASSSPYDWRSTLNDDLWQGYQGVNDICPDGYRLPTTTEWAAEIATWDTENIAGAYGSVLKLPACGYRGQSDGNVVTASNYHVYASQGIYDEDNTGLINTCDITATSAVGSSGQWRAGGYNVRCIKN